ncbi:MAG TPA: DUF1190 domain-containing protein [Alphaproteobacteria bacterium]|jgi:uncharacterized protein YgiB involved in biofilm formation
MKRSRYVALLAMGASALALSACGESETPAGVYTSVDQCIADKQFTEAECKKAFAVAKEEHKKVAPKYASKADCETDFGVGKCEESPYRTSTGGYTFMPYFVGYMLGRSLSGQPAFTPQPLYRTQNGTQYRTGDNRPVTAKTGVQNVPRSTTTSAFKSTTTTRGGFGRSGAVYGSTSSSPRTSSSGS